MVIMQPKEEQDERSSNVLANQGPLCLSWASQILGIQIMSLL